MLPNRDIASLADICTAIDEILDFTAGFDLEMFSTVRETRLACICLLQNVGEATKRLSPELRGVHPEVPWKRMAGLRDKLVHGYDVVDDVAIWGVIKAEIPRLLPAIKAILHELERS